MSCNQFTGLGDATWGDFRMVYPSDVSSNDDVITTTTEAPRTRNTQDLSAQIKAAGGALTVSPNDSRYIVAVNNGLRYSVIRLPDGQYRITESSGYLYLIGGAALLGIVLLMRN